MAQERTFNINIINNLPDLREVYPLEPLEPKRRVIVMGFGGFGFKDLSRERQEGESFRSWLRRARLYVALSAGLGIGLVLNACGGGVGDNNNNEAQPQITPIPLGGQELVFDKNPEIAKIAARLANGERLSQKEIKRFNDAVEELRKQMATPPSTPTSETSSIQITPTPRSRTPEPTPEVYKYQESIGLLNQIKEFFNPENPETQKRLGEFNIDMGPFGDYRTRRERVLPLIEQIQELIKKENLEEAKLRASTLRQGLLSTLRTTDGKRDNHTINRQDVEDFQKIDSENRVIRKFVPGELNLSGFLLPAYKNEFPKNYKPELLSIPCLDSLCGSTNYPQEILALKPKIQAISSIEPQVLEDIFKKFEAAAFVGGQKSQWANYFDAFQSLKSEYQRTKDEKIKKVAGELSNFMQANFSETYQKIKAGQKSHYLEI